MRDRIIAAIAITFLSLALTIPFLHVYFIREDGSGEVLWNANEVYCFIAFSRRGLEVNYIRYPWFAFTENFGAVEAPDFNSRYLVAIHVTSSGVEQHTFPLKDRAPGPTEYTPHRGWIYANDPAIGGLCRWAGDRFEPATPEEQIEFLGVSRLSSQEFQNKDGWSKRGFGAGSDDYNFLIDVGDKFKLAIRNLAVHQNGRGTLLIDVMRPGKAPARILDRRIRWQKVSSAEYQRAFQDRE
jgi:hypothetical protein